MIHSLTGKRETFCQLVAADETYTNAYIEAYQKPAGYDRKLAAESGSRLMANTDIVLRVQELRRPVIRKLRRKIEYGLQKAFGQCEIAWDLAYEKGDPRAMLKAIEMQSKLAKLLSEDVTHRHGLLDETDTEILLAMKKEFENRREKQKKLAATQVMNQRIVLGTTHQAPLGEVVNGSHRQYF
jgi:hypothetical protein